LARQHDTIGGANGLGVSGYFDLGRDTGALRRVGQRSGGGGQVAATAVYDGDAHRERKEALLFCEKEAKNF
jgi:hypothetical protein